MTERPGSRFVRLPRVLWLVLRSRRYAVAAASWNQEMVTWTKIALAFFLDP